ncbi:amidohydrolase family protein [Lachnospiraceae bacterium 62-35]
MGYILEGGLIITMDEENRGLKDSAIVVENDRITDIGPAREMMKQYGNQDLEHIDCTGKVVFPGFINIHTHQTLSIIRGVAEDMGTAPAYTKSVPQGPFLSPDDCYAMASLGAVEALRFGSTLIADMYTNSHQNAEVFGKVGIRAMVTEMVHDMDFFGLPTSDYRVDHEMGEKLLQSNIDLIEKYNGSFDGRIQCNFGPHAPDTCSPEFLCRISDLSRQYGIGMSTHLAQSPREMKRIKEISGTSSTKFMEDCGMFDSKFTVCAHAIFCDEEDRNVLAKHPNVSIAHAAEGNAKGGMVAHISEMRHKGINIGIATDNGAANMIETMRIAVCSGKVLTNSCDDPLPMDVLRMATINGAKALGLEKDLGSIEIGKKADMVLVDYRKPHMVPCIDAVGTLVHTGLGSDVDTVMIDGKIVVRDGKVLTVDVDDIMREAQRTADRKWRDVNPGLDRKYMMVDFI